MSLYVDVHKKLGSFCLDVHFETGGDCLGLLGASGCGKSMTLKCIAGIVTPDSGKIVLNGRVLFDSEKKINLPPQKRRVGYLFQNYALFPNMTVEENIGIGISVKDKAEKKRIVESYVRSFQLEEQRRQYPAQLSGGQQQRVALARILASQPEVLMLDEPFSALDYYLKEEMHFELQKTLRAYEGDVLIVTHSRDEVYRFCPRLVVLVKGQMVDEGEMRELFDHPVKLATARLSGCKNISAARRLDAHHIYAEQWNITFEVEEEIAETVHYVGVRAHDIRPVNSETAGGCRFRAEMEEVSSGPFETSVLFRGSRLWWKISTEEWENCFAGHWPEEFTITDGKLLLLED